jgi:hypothetical protein
MSHTVAVKTRLVAWAMLLLPLLYILLMPPMYHLCYRTMYHRLPQVDYSLKRRANEVMDVCAKPYWLLAQHAPLDLETPLFGYDAYWRDMWRDKFVR